MKAQDELAPGRVPGDCASGIVQIIGGGLAAVGLPFLFIGAIRSGRAALITGVSLYSACILGYFSLSAVAHLLGSPRARRVFEILEEAGSFLLVAGSLTPLCLSGLGGGPGWTALGLLWGLGALGFLAYLFGPSRPGRLAFPLYLVAFTLALPFLPAVRASLPAPVFPWIPVAGVSFAAGLGFRSRRGMPYNHAIWHCFTGAASVLLYFAILSLV